jgi:hypothetical protein
MYISQRVKLLFVKKIQNPVASSRSAIQNHKKLSVPISGSKLPTIAVMHQSVSDIETKLAQLLLYKLYCSHN